MNQPNFEPLLCPHLESLFYVKSKGIQLKFYKNYGRSVFEEDAINVTQVSDFVRGKLSQH